MALRVLHSSLSPWIPSGAREASFVLVMAGGLLIGHAWTFQLVDQRGWSFVGLGRDAWRSGPIVTSTIVGAVAIAVPCAVLLGLGWLQVIPSEPGSSLGAGLAALAVLIPAALWEELFLRGYAFSLVRERWGPLLAIGVTSLVFALLHLLNEGSSGRVFAIVVIAGFFLGFVRDVTGSVYCAWAAHLAWNAMLVVVLHAPVSGLVMATPDYRIVDAGPDWATGGTWGPEGSWFAALGLVLATWYVIWRAQPRAEPDA